MKEVIKNVKPPTKAIISPVSVPDIAGANLSKT